MTQKARPAAVRRGPLELLDRLLRGLVTATSVLVLPVSLLLFLQWPLREWVQAYSREANDLAQVLFALYVSVAISAATRHRSHLAADAFARRYSDLTRSTLARLGSALVLIPWSAFVVYAAWPSVMQSVRQLEGFPETFTPGYFMIKIALLLLALLVLGQAIVDVFLPRAHDDP